MTLNRVVLLVASDGDGIDGIADYTSQLAEATRSTGPEVVVLGRVAGQWQRQGHTGSSEKLTADQVSREARSADAVVLQYNPFSWGRRGFAPGLLWLLRDLRTGSTPPVMAAMLHERFAPWGDWRESAMSGWQRLQLMTVRRLTDLRFLSTETWVSERRGIPGPQDLWLPVGSNLPDMRPVRVQERAQRELSDEHLVVAAFGSDHPSYLSGHVSAVVNRLISRIPVTLINLGATARRPPGLDPRVHVIELGRTEPDRLAAALAASDIFVAPFVDGVSTRRTTVMAALQHELPVVGTTGSSTGPILGRNAALRLSAVSDASHMGDDALRWCERSERKAAAHAARRLYDEQFRWSVIARRMVGALAAATWTGARLS